MKKTKRKRTHFRGKPRPGRRVPLRYHPKGEQDGEVESFTRNIGVGGAFILSDDPFPEGTELQLAVDVPTCDDAIQMLAEVRWCAPADDAADGAGMGVEFLDLSLESLFKLSEYFASLTGTDEA